MKVLISAYACAPDTGSEPGAGWEFVRLAAEQHDVWVLSCATYRDRFDAGLKAAGLGNVTVEYLGDSETAHRARRIPHGTVLYCLIWQAQARRRAQALHEEIGFDLVHHVTFGTDWMPAGVLGVPAVPTIWGPVGGATRMPWSAWRWVGFRGLAEELARDAITTVMRRLVGRRMAGRADVTLVQNRDGEAALRPWANYLEVFPNVIVDHGGGRVAEASAEHSPDSPGGASRRAVFVARLMPWKGLRIAVAALAEPAAANWSLDIYGDGPERAPAHRLAVRLGVADRIRFLGQVAHAEVLEALSEADALIAPSLHEAAGVAIAEAVASGCPVVTVDRGGPDVVVEGDAGLKVPVSSRLPRDLAQALAGVGARRPPSDRWSRDTFRAQVRRIYAIATTSGAPRPGAAIPSATPGDDRIDGATEPVSNLWPSSL